MIKTFSIGVDIGGTRTKYGLVDECLGNVVQQVIFPTEKNDAHLFLKQVEGVINDFNDSVSPLQYDIGSIGFGIPGFINEENVIITTYGFLSFMENYPLKDIVEKKFNIPCLMDNDARTVGLGEALYGEGRNYKRVLTLTLGTGVGFGFVVNGKFTDPLPLSHMGGHMKILENGALCYCGKTGCLEALLSSTGIINLAKINHWNGQLSAEAIFEAAFHKDVIAVKVVDHFINCLQTGIYNYVNLFAPDMIVLGGGIAQSLHPYFDRIKSENYLLPYPGYSFELRISKLGELSGILGSAALFQLNKL